MYNGKAEDGAERRLVLSLISLPQKKSICLRSKVHREV